MPNWESGSLLVMIRGGFWQWLQRGSITFRGDLGSGLTLVALGQDSTVVATVTTQTARVTPENPGPGGLREGLTWERRGRKGRRRGLGSRVPAPHLWRAPVFCNPRSTYQCRCSLCLEPLGAPRPRSALTHRLLWASMPQPAGSCSPHVLGEQTDPEGQPVTHWAELAQCVGNSAGTYPAPWIVASVSSPEFWRGLLGYPRGQSSVRSRSDSSRGCLK